LVSNLVETVCKEIIGQGLGGNFSAFNIFHENAGVLVVEVDDLFNVSVVVADVADVLKAGKLVCSAVQGTLGNPAGTVRRFL